MATAKASSTISIHIVTDADVKGFTQAKAAANELRTATGQLTQSTNAGTAAQKAEADAAKTAAREAIKAAAETRKQAAATSAAAKAGKEHAEVTPAIVKGNDAVAKSGANVGRSMLLFSQGFEDAQYGIGAVLNNIPQLTLALGLGAGLTGALSVAAVSAKFLWDRLGDLGAKADSTGKILVQSLPGDEMAAEQRRFAESVAMVAYAYDKQREAITAAQTKLAEKAAFDERMREVARREEERLTGKPQSAASFEREQMANFTGREQVRAGERSTAEKLANSAEDEAAKAHELEASQNQRIAGIDTVFRLDAQIKDDLKKRKEAEAAIAAQMQNAEGDPKEAARINAQGGKRLAAIDAEIAKKKARQLELPSPPNVKITGDAEKDQAALNEKMKPEQDRLIELKKDADAKSLKAAAARENVGKVYNTTTQANTADFYDTNERIQDAQKKEADKRKAYKIAKAARVQPKGIQEEALRGLEGLAKDAKGRGDTDGLRAVLPALTAAKKSNAVTPALIVQMQEALDKIAGTPAAESPSATRVKGSIDAARKFDETTRATPPPKAPNIPTDGVPTPAGDFQVQTPGTGAAQEALETLGNQAAKAGNQPKAREARAASQDIGDGQSAAEIDRLTNLVVQLNQRGDEASLKLAQTLNEFIAKAVAKLNSAEALAAQAQQQMEAMNIRQ